MIIGYDVFGGSSFYAKIPENRYHDISFLGGLIDHIYADEDATDFKDASKPTTWRYTTLFNATLNKTLEAGSVQAEGYQIDRIRVQKRKISSLEWEDVYEIDYNMDEGLLYHEFLDNVVSNDATYQYSIVPISSQIIGDRVISEPITVSFDGVFLSDIENNVCLLYNVEISDITHNRASSTTSLKGYRYPVVTFGRSQFLSFNVSAMYIAEESLLSNTKQVEIGVERDDLQTLIAFLQDGRPKIYRDAHGNLAVVAVEGDVVESPHPRHAGRSNISFDLVEIANTNAETLQRLNLVKEVVK